MCLEKYGKVLFQLYPQEKNILLRNSNTISLIDHSGNSLFFPLIQFPKHDFFPNFYPSSSPFIAHLYYSYYLLIGLPAPQLSFSTFATCD